ncbi:MAG: PHP domain-containing protein [Pleomorphochaeta sp.]
MKIKIDLHNHSCLSPCGSDDMLPSLIAFEAMEKQIDILALTDHNCSRNLEPFKEACELCEIIPIFGMEVNTIEDVHVLALFKNIEDAKEFGFFIEALLPDIKNDPKLFGNQNIVDIQGNIISTFEKSLLTTCGISLEDVVNECLSRDGLVIPAHIDKKANSVLSNLGFLPDLNYSALEAIRPFDLKETYNKTVIQGSDAHYLEHIGRRSCYLEVNEVSYEGLKQGLIDGKVSYMS